MIARNAEETRKTRRSRRRNPEHMTRRLRHARRHRRVSPVSMAFRMPEPGEGVDEAKRVAGAVDGLIGGLPELSLSEKTRDRNGKIAASGNVNRALLDPRTLPPPPAAEERRARAIWRRVHRPPAAIWCATARSDSHRHRAQCRHHRRRRSGVTPPRRSWRTIPNLLN
jgi:hypothetical protein